MEKYEILYKALRHEQNSITKDMYSNTTKAKEDVYADMQNSKESIEKIRKEPEKLTAGLLRELLGDRNIPELKAFLQNRNDNEALDLLNRNDYIAAKLWTKMDVMEKATEMGYEITEEGILEVIHNNNLKCLNDCTDNDWAIIEQAIIEQAINQL